MNTKLKDIVILTIALLPFLYWLYTYINVDLWYDEVVSIKHFMLVNFKKTFFYYPAPNNHIFFNFVNQVLTRITNCRDFVKIAEHVYILRAFQGLIALATGYYSVLITKRFFNLQNSLLVLVVLFTTIPFMNFSLQLRGYSLSILLVTMTIYHVLTYIESCSSRNRNLIVISSALLMYTIPSNIYLLASMVVPLGILWLYHLKLNNEKINIYFKSIFFIGLGVVIATVLYLPVIKSVLFNQFATRELTDTYYSLKLIPILQKSFLSKRYLLLGLSFIGVLFFLRKTSKKEKVIYASLLFTLFFPFVLSFVHQKFPFQRVFVPLVPLFCILITVPVIYLINQIPKPKFAFVCYIALSLYCLAIFYNEVNTNNEQPKFKLINKHAKVQNVYQNYFLSDFFKQKETMQLLKTQHSNKPVFLLRQLDMPSTEFYLSINNIAYKEIESLNEIEPALSNEGKVFIVTSKKKGILKNLNKKGYTSTEVLTEDYAFTNIIVVTEKL